MSSMLELAGERFTPKECRAAILPITVPRQAANKVMDM